jgi:phage antirepressor YoqD-like protein
MTTSGKKIAIKAAQFLYETGSSNFSFAINKSAKQLNITNPKLFPKQNEVLIELKILNDLYGCGQSDLLESENFKKFWFTNALKFVKKVEIFQPYLVDPLANSILNPDTPIDLHFFTITTEELAIFLIDKKINYQLKEMKLLLAKQNLVNIAYFESHIEQIPVRLFVFDMNKPAIRPINPIDQKPVRYYQL